MTNSGGIEGFLKSKKKISQIWKQNVSLSKVKEPVIEECGKPMHSIKAKNACKELDSEQKNSCAEIGTKQIRKLRGGYMEIIVT